MKNVNNEIIIDLKKEERDNMKLQNFTTGALLMVTVLFSPTVFTQDEAASNKRSSYIAYSIDASKNEYRNHTISGAWGIDSRWALGALASTSNDQNKNRYQEGSLYLSALWNDIFSNKIILRSNNDKTESLLGNGADLQTKIKYPLFNIDLISEFSFTFGKMNYKQTTNTTGTLGNIRSEVDFTQSFIVLSFDQDLTEWLSLGASTTKYSYEDASRTTFSGRNNKFTASQNLDSTSDYPDQKTSFRINGSWKYADVGLSRSETKSKLVNNDSKTTSLFVTIPINANWSTSVGIDSTKYDNSTSKSETGSLGVEYLI